MIEKKVQNGERLPKYASGTNTAKLLLLVANNSINYYKNYDFIFA